MISSGSRGPTRRSLINPMVLCVISGYIPPFDVSLAYPIGHKEPAHLVVEVLDRSVVQDEMLSPKAIDQVFGRVLPHHDWLVGVMHLHSLTTLLLDFLDLIG